MPIQAHGARKTTKTGNDDGALIFKYNSHSSVFSKWPLTHYVIVFNKEKMQVVVYCYGPSGLCEPHILEKW